MTHSVDYHTFWVIPVLVILIALGRTLWAYRGSSEWPIADGTIVRLDVQRKEDADGHYICATFTYEFEDLQGHRITGTWYKNFSTEPEARDFALRELPVEKRVPVRFNPKDPGINDLELYSSTYTNDRPTTLGV